MPMRSLSEETRAIIYLHLVGGIGIIGRNIEDGRNAGASAEFLARQEAALEREKRALAEFEAFEKAECMRGLLTTTERRKSNLPLPLVVAILALLLLAWPAAAQIPPVPQDQIAVASCTAICDTAVLTTSGYATVSVAATGTGTVLTFSVEGKDASGTWRTLAAVVPTVPGTFVTTMGANGIWLVGCAGFSQVRAHLSAITAGTETFSLEGSVRSNVNVGQ